MMTKNQINEREQLEMLTIDQLVPEDHLVRKLEATIDFPFIYPLVKNFYSAYGRSSIDPVVLFKMTFIQYVFGIRSMRQTIKEIEMNMAYRWFLGFGFHTEVPHFSTFDKNYVRRLNMYAIPMRSNKSMQSAKERLSVSLRKRWTTLRGLKNLSMQAMLTFAAMNLKKLATWTWQSA